MLLEHALVAVARRRWPILRLLPKRWVQAAANPIAVRMRRKLARGTLAIAATAVFILVVMGMSGT